MKNPFRRGNENKSSIDGNGLQLNIILYSSSDNAHHHFCVSEKMSVGAFIELALTHLSEGQGAERVEALKRYYEPVLELQDRENNRELPQDKSLMQAGVYDQAVCQIAARPRKERMMFCRTSG